MPQFDAGEEDEFVDDDDDDVHWPQPEVPRHYQPPIGPYFDPVYPMNVSVLAGQAVTLSCRVKNLGDRLVTILSSTSPSSRHESLSSWFWCP